jgi:ABC-type branched-subunit amino acid transport system ATPase component
MSSDTLLEARGVTKEFGGLTAVSDVDDPDLQRNPD